jgi:Pvc16 N-terminal domain/CarboxypepD_reg-like domain
MIQDVDDTLRRLLTAELTNTPGCPIHDRDQITFDAPAVAEAVQDGEAHVNLYLHDVRENLEMRDESFRVTSKLQDGDAGRRRAPVRLDLGYLVTAYAGDDPAAEHRLLADLLGVLLRYQAAPPKHLAGLLAGQGSNALLLAVAQPDHVANADPPALWQALGGRLRPALSLVATAPFDPFETKWTKAVREAVVGLSPGASSRAPGRPLHLSGVQVSTAGVVVDQESEQLLAGVAVTVDGREETTTTDDRGFFYLTNLPVGSHTLRFQRRGCRAEPVSVDAAPAGRPDQLTPLVIAMRTMDDLERAIEEAVLAAAVRNVPGLSEAGQTAQVSITGRLRLAGGRPAAYIPLRAGRQSTSTDADGFYCFFDLLSGDHKVIVDLPGYGEVTVPLQEHAGVSVGNLTLPERKSETDTTATSEGRG